MTDGTGVVDPEEEARNRISKIEHLLQIKHSLLHTCIYLFGASDMQSRAERLGFCEDCRQAQGLP